MASDTMPHQLQDPAFRKRRTQNWMLLGLLYALFYMTRYNFAATMGDLASDFGWSNSDLGLFEFWMPMVYGLSVVFNGPIADRVGGKRAFLFGAVGVTIMNLLFGACFLFLVEPAVVQGVGHDFTVITPAVIGGGIAPKTLLYAMVAIWAINGYFQSFGALSIVKVNAQWFHVLERGTFAGIFGVLIRFGLVLAFSGVPFLAATLGLRWAYWIPGLLVGVMFLLNYLWMADSPEDAGYGDYDTGDAGADEDSSARPSLVFLLRKIFASRTTWTIAVASMMIGMVRRSTVDSWNPKYFKEVYMSLHGGEIATFLPYQLSSWGIMLLGIAGGFAFGMTSDRKFGGRRAPVIVFGFTGMAVVLALFGLADHFVQSAWIAAISLACLSFFVNGAHGMIGGAASMDFGGRKAAATAAGLFDGMQYLAAAFVGPGMGYILDRWGWSAWQWWPIPFAVAGAVIMSTLWNATPGKRGH